MAALDDLFGTQCTKCGAYIPPKQEHDCKGGEDCIHNHYHDQYITSDGEGNELRWCNTCDNPITEAEDGTWRIDRSRL